MVSVVSGEAVRGIGARLRTARERKGLSVLQAAEKLHVDARVLEALEAEDFNALGADVYARGHLRRYAELSGESPAELQLLYTRSAHVARPDLTRIPHRESSPRSSLLLPALVVVVGFGVAGLLWWIFTLSRQGATTLAAQPPPGAVGAAAPIASADSASPGARAALSGAPAPAGGPAAAASASGGAQVSLQMKVAELNWVEISDADGRRLLDGLIEGGTTRELYGTPPLRVVLGNAPAVGLALDGRPLNIDGLVHRNGSVHLLIDASGRVSAAAPRLANGD
jgi:cytoskeleton protein RodZ